MGGVLRPSPKASYHMPTVAGCMSCGCQSSGSCGTLIEMLQKAAIDARQTAEAARQGDSAMVAALQRRCLEAEERLRRSDWENAMLKSEADTMRQRLEGQPGGNGRHLDNGCEQIKPGSVEAQSLAKLLTATLAEAKTAGTDAAARAEASAGGNSSDGGPDAATNDAARESFRELCNSLLDPDTGSSLKTWTVSKWLQSIGLCDVVADILLARLRGAQLPSDSSASAVTNNANAATNGVASTLHGNSAQRIASAPSTERAFARRLGEHGSRELVAALLRESPVSDLIAGAVWRGAERLAAEAKYADATPSHRPLPHKMCEDGVSSLGFAAASARLVHGGLDVLLGGVADATADAWAKGGGGDTLLAAMRAEHCERTDSRDRFSEPDYGMPTTS